MFILLTLLPHFCICVGSGTGEDVVFHQQKNPVISLVVPNYGGVQGGTDIIISGRYIFLNYPIKTNIYYFVK